MDPFLYVREEFNNVKRALDESLRFDYGPGGQTGDYYEECRFRLAVIEDELERLHSGTVSAGQTATIVGQLWDLANRLALIERSHLGEFSWPFAEAIREIAMSLLSEDECLEGKVEPIIHMIAEGTTYQISHETVMGASQKRRLYTVAFPRQLKHHVLMHALFGHELGHATFYSNRQAPSLFGGDPPSKKIIAILRREGPLRDVAAATQWLASADAPATVKAKMAKTTGKLTETNLGHWLVELICDLFGLALFGPAFAAAHRTYLEPSTRNAYEIDVDKASHPAYALRRQTLIGAMRSLGWLTPVADTGHRKVRAAERGLIDYIGEDGLSSWAATFTDAQLGEVFEVIGGHFVATDTPMARRPDDVTLVALIERLANHLPPIREDINEDGVSTTHSVRLDEQLYAGWTYWIGRKALDKTPLTFFELNQLCDLALLQQRAIDISKGTRSV